MLSVLFLLVFLAASWDGKSSADIGRASFTEGKRPQNWGRVEGRFFFVVVFSGAIVAFGAMAWFVDNVTFFSLAQMLTYTGAMVYVAMIRKNINRYFSNPRFAPEPEDPRATFVIRRREVVEEYLGRPHLMKEFLMVCACLAAAGLSVNNPVWLSNWAGAVPYLIISVAVLANESTMIWWRRTRSRKIQAIDDEEAASDANSLGELD